MTSAASDRDNADLTAVVEGAPVAGVEQLASDGRRAGYVDVLSSLDRRTIQPR